MRDSLLCLHQAPHREIVQNIEGQSAMHCTRRLITNYGRDSLHCFASGASAVSGAKTTGGTVCNALHQAPHQVEDSG